MSIVLIKNFTAKAVVKLFFCLEYIILDIFLKNEYYTKNGLTLRHIIDLIHEEYDT